MFWIKKIPVFGTLFLLANSYAYGGDGRAKKEFAPIKLWVKAFFWNIFFSLCFTVLTLWTFVSQLFNQTFCSGVQPAALTGFAATPGVTIVGVFPNLLGLGIGIYALLFALDSNVIREMHFKMKSALETGLRKHGSVLILNSDMAFPLCALLVIVAMGIIAQFFPDQQYLQIFCWVTFWYGLIIILEIIALLFGLIDNSLLEKADTGVTSDSTGSRLGDRNNRTP